MLFAALSSLWERLRRPKTRARAAIPHPLAALPPLAVEQILELLSTQEKVLLCASSKALLPWLEDGQLWRDVRFHGQTSASRPLAAHLHQFQRWAAAHEAHLRRLAVVCSPHTADPSVPVNRWSYASMAPPDWEALLGLLRALRGAQLAELALEVHALPPGADGLLLLPSQRCLPASELQLPGLEVLSLAFPMAALSTPLAHLSRLRTLRLEGVELPALALLPASLTALEGSSRYIDEWNSADAIAQLPLLGSFAAPGLRSLAIKGGCDAQGQRPLSLGGLGQLGGLASLAIEGPRLCVGFDDDDEEEGEEDSEAEDSEDEGAAAAQPHGAQLTPVMREMARLQALERLCLRSVSGVATSGQPLTLPRWPALKELEIWAVSDVTELRISGLPALQARCSLVPELAVGCCDELAALTVSDLPALETLSVRAYSRWGNSFAQLTLSALPRLARVEASPEALALLPALPGVTGLELAGDPSELTPAHIDALARLPQLACMAHWTPYSSEEKKAAAAVLRRLRQRLPNLAIEAQRH